jgi:hypothetical protein
MYQSTISGAGELPTTLDARLSAQFNFFGAESQPAPVSSSDHHGVIPPSVTVSDMLAHAVSASYASLPSTRLSPVRTRVPSSSAVPGHPTATVSTSASTFRSGPTTASGSSSSRCGPGSRIPPPPAIISTSPLPAVGAFPRPRFEEDENAATDNAIGSTTSNISTFAGNTVTQRLHTQVLASSQQITALETDVATLRQALADSQAQLRLANERLRWLFADPASLDDSPPPESEALPVSTSASVPVTHPDSGLTTFSRVTGTTGTLLAATTTAANPSLMPALQRLYTLETELERSLTRVRTTIRTTLQTQSHRCVICQERPSDQLILPCAHVATCGACAVSLLRCPMCRTDIHQMLKVFLV